MLQRTVHSNGVVTYQSPQLGAAGVVHAFSTRVGGVSTGGFAALNLGNPGGGEKDAEGNIQENYRRLQEAIGGAEMARAWVKQVHGNAVEFIDPEPEGEYGETPAAEVRDRYTGQISADGMGTTLPGVLLTIRVADCVPVLLAAGDGRVVGAVHAGWRGVVAGVVERALGVMREAGVPADQVVAAIGPGISAEHFEVSEEVAAEFVRAGLAEAVRAADGGTPRVDLQRAVRAQLERGGVTRIDGNDVCTFRDAGDFYSHRRAGGRTGRMAAVIAARA